MIAAAVPGASAMARPGAGYSWAVMDPGGKSVWLATEYVPPKSSQTADGIRDWGTRMMDVSTP